MFQSLYHVAGGRFVVLRDGRVSGFSQPEPPFLQRRYEHAQALRELRSAGREAAAGQHEARGLVARIRFVLGLG